MEYEGTLNQNDALTYLSILQDIGNSILVVGRRTSELVKMVGKENLNYVINIEDCDGEKEIILKNNGIGTCVIGEITEENVRKVVDLIDRGINVVAELITEEQRDIDELRDYLDNFEGKFTTVVILEKDDGLYKIYRDLSY